MNPHPETSLRRASRFRTLYEANYADVLRFVTRRVHPSHAEDITAEAFLVVWRRLDEVPAGTGTRPWIFGVARHTIQNTLRGDRRREALAVRIADAGGLTAVASAASEAELAAQRIDLVAAWRRLSASHQEALALGLWDGLTAPQAARVLGITPVAFRLRLSRARRAIRRELEMTVPVPIDPSAVTGRSSS